MNQPIRPKRTVMSLALVAAVAAMVPNAYAVTGTTIDIVDPEPAVILNDNDSLIVDGTVPDTGVPNTGAVAGGSSAGVTVEGAAGTITNTGAISGLQGVLIQNGMSLIELDNYASLSGTSEGIRNLGSITTLNNAVGGAISATGGAGILNGGQIGTLTNAGDISSSGGAGLQNTGSMGSFANSGQITSSVSGVAGLDNSGTITSMSNSGTIEGSMNVVGGGIGLLNSGSIGQLSNTGTIGGGTIGMSITGTIGELDNLGSHGTIGGYADGMDIGASGTLGSLSNTGSILGVTFGIHNLGAMGTLTNQAGGVINASMEALDNAGLISLLSNAGTLSGNMGVDNEQAGTITDLENQAGGKIATNDIGIENLGFIGTLNNAGTISGASNGVFNGGTITTLTNGGSISVTGTTAAAVLNDGPIGALTNNGTISGLTGVRNAATGTIGSFVNNAGATITGVADGSGDTTYGLNNQGTILSFSNHGLLTAPDYALYNDTGGTIGQLNNDGVIAGNIANLSSNALSIVGGTGSAVGTLTGFGGSIGSISNLNSDVILAGGNTLLNDNVDLGGTHTLNNLSSTLQVNSQLSINGNYNQGASASLVIGVADGAQAAGSTASDTGYGRLVVSGDATIASGSSVSLQKLNAYQFAAGQRFVVVDAGQNSTYNEGSLQYSASGYTGSISGQNVTSNGRADLVVVLGATDSGTGSGSTGSGSGSTGSGTGSGSGTDTGSGSGTGTGTGSSGSGTGTGTGTGTGSTGSGSGSSTAVTTVNGVPVTATTPNSVASIGGLLHYTGVSDPGLLNLFNAAVAEETYGTPAQSTKAGAQLGPISQASAAAHAAAAPTADVIKLISVRANTLRIADAGTGSGIATGDATPRFGVWGQAFGGHASQDTREDVDGFSANYAGIVVGFDTAVGKNWLAGGVFSYANTKVDNSGATAGDTTSINSFGFMGYASYGGKPWYLNLSTGVTPEHFDSTRQINFDGFSGTAQGSYGGLQYVARAEAGLPLSLGSAKLTPEVSLTYMYSHSDSYTESAGNGAALSVGSTHDNSVRSAIGAKIDKAFSTSYGQVVPELSVRWEHEFLNSRIVTGASFAADPTGQTAFTTKGASPVRDFADVGLGVTLLRANNLSLTARYDLQAGSGFLSQTGSLRLRQLF